MTDDRQQTLFNLHECLQEAAFEEPYLLPSPVMGRPASASKDLAWVEQCLFDASDEEGREHKKLPETSSMTASFIVGREDKAELDRICRTNGTSASAFLRQCARRLVAEYRHGG